MSIQTSDCQIQIQILIDETAVNGNGTSGIYMVDNRLQGGTSGLMTRCTSGSKICWRVSLINPYSKSTAQIQRIGNSGAWDFEQPQPAPDDTSAFTGRVVTTSGNWAYPLALDLNLPDRGGITVNFTPMMVVSA